MRTIHLVCFSLTVLLFSVAGAAAQLPPPTVTVTPHPNPSSSLVLPAPGQTPVYSGPTGTAPGGRWRQPSRHQPSGQSAAQRASCLAPAAALLRAVLCPALPVVLPVVLPAVARRATGERGHRSRVAHRTAAQAAGRGLATASATQGRRQCRCKWRGGDPITDARRVRRCGINGGSVLIPVDEKWNPLEWDSGQRRNTSRRPGMDRTLAFA